MNSVVDIMQGDVHAFDPRSGEDKVYATGQPVGAVTPTVRGDWLAAVRDGSVRGSASATRRGRPSKMTARQSQNDAIAIRAAVSGGMSMSHVREAGALYRLDPTAGSPAC
jgi:sugar lactone lactonase YvrE